MATLYCLGTKLKPKRVGITGSSHSLRGDAYCIDCRVLGISEEATFEEVQEARNFLYEVRRIQDVIHWVELLGWVEGMFLMQSFFNLYNLYDISSLPAMESRKPLPILCLTKTSY